LRTKKRTKTTLPENQHRAALLHACIGEPGLSRQGGHSRPAVSSDGVCTRQRLCDISGGDLYIFIGFIPNILEQATGRAYVTTSSRAEVAASIKAQRSTMTTTASNKRMPTLSDASKDVKVGVRLLKGVIDSLSKAPIPAREKRHLKTDLSAVSYRIEKEAIRRVTMANHLTGAEEIQRPAREASPAK